MKLAAQLTCITLTAILLQACQLGEDDSDDTGETKAIYLTTDDFNGTVSSDDEYELTISADSNIVTLENNVSEISITGSGSTLTIDSDTLIDSIYINGGSNRIIVEDDVELIVTDLTIIGNGNNISVFDITNTPIITSAADEADNVVCENAVCL